MRGSLPHAEVTRTTPEAAQAADDASPKPTGIHSFGSLVIGDDETVDRAFDPELAQLLLDRGWEPDGDDHELFSWPPSTPHTDPRRGGVPGFATSLTITSDGAYNAWYATTANVSEPGREHFYRSREALIADLDRLETVRADTAAEPANGLWT